VVEDACLPERQHRSDDEDEIADEEEMNEAHMPKNKGLRAKGSGLQRSLLSPRP
jgi:hypothetical protein